VARRKKSSITSVRSTGRILDSIRRSHPKLKTLQGFLGFQAKCPDRLENKLNAAIVRIEKVNYLDLSEGIELLEFCKTKRSVYHDDSIVRLARTVRMS